MATSGRRVEVEQSGEWWAITVPSPRGVFSQARHLDEVPAAACEAIAMTLDVERSDVGPIEVRVQPQPGGAELLAKLGHAGDSPSSARRFPQAREVSTG